MKTLFIAYLAVLHMKCFVESTGLRQEFTWTRISYATSNSYSSGGRPYRSYGTPPVRDSFLFPDTIENADQAKQSVSKNNNNDYIYQHNIPMGANRWKDKLFITVPRRRLGIPSTLNYVPINSNIRHNVPLRPYPDLRTNSLRSNGGASLTSVYRVSVDPCDRLWMVDTGVLELPGNRTVLGPQRIVIIDLNTDKIIKTYNFRHSDIPTDTALALVTVDVTAETCDNAYAYFPDYAGYGLIVYSLKSDESWRVKHNYFYLEPLGGEFDIGGVKFQWNDGVFSGALTEMQSDGNRTYIFHSMAGTHLYAVSTGILRNKELATRSYHGNDLKVLGNRGPDSQTSASDLHQSSGILFLALVNENGVGCWNVKKPFHVANFGFVQRDASTMIYPTDVKVYKDDVIVLTNTMPLFLYSELNYDIINFRVWINNVYDAVKGTACAIEDV